MPSATSSSAEMYTEHPRSRPLRCERRRFAASCLPIGFEGRRRLHRGERRRLRKHGGETLKSASPDDARAHFTLPGFAV